MIRLILRPQQLSTTFQYEDKPRIIIGGAQVEGVDIALENTKSTEIQVVIESTPNGFVAYNKTNNPFTTINKEPFGKRILKDKDLLLVAETEILVELVETKKISGDQLVGILDQAISTSSATKEFSPDLDKELLELEYLSQEPWESESKAFSNPEDFDLDEIDALVREVEALEWEEMQALGTFPPTTSSTYISPIKRKPVSPYHLGNEIKQSSAVTEPKPPKNTLKEVVKGSLENMDEEPLDPNYNAKTPPNQIFTEIKKSKHWRWWIGFALFILIIIALIGGSYFFQMRDKRRLEELKAAQGVADIAMALTYAKVNNLKPQKHNWVDPGFIKKNLGAVLSSKYQILATIDAQGQFSNSPYLLRIYTNNDLSQFLVMAQPAPSFLQWLAPKTTLIVDSKEMEMRKLQDLKEINRLLVNPKTFEGHNADEISKVIKGGELIPLVSLTTSRSQLGFAPPQSLAIMRPGAEKRIYNAPRYYIFGERLLNKLIKWPEDYSSEHDLVHLREELKLLSKLPDLALYSTQGMLKAFEAQKALANFGVDNNFMVGHLKISNHGKVLTSQFLLKNDPITVPTKRPLDEEEVAIEENHTTKDTKALEDNLEVLSEREKILRPIANEISSLAAAYSRQFDAEKATRLKELIQQIFSLDEIQESPSEEMPSILKATISTSLSQKELINTLNATLLSPHSTLKDVDQKDRAHLLHILKASSLDEEAQEYFLNEFDLLSKKHNSDRI